MIRVENVSKQFNKTRALKNVNLEVNKGDIISLIGPSGSGKSTLLRCIHGLEHVDSGKIYMDDELLQSLRKKETIKELQSKFYRKAYDIATDEFETGDDVFSFYL